MINIEHRHWPCIVYMQVWIHDRFACPLIIQSQWGNGNDKEDISHEEYVLTLIYREVGTWQVDEGRNTASKTDPRRWDKYTTSPR